MHVRTYASIYTTSLLGLLCLAMPAWAAEEGPASAKLKEQMLSDEKIAELCHASIKQKYDMVAVEDEIGAVRKVPRCVANYEAMRAVADSYIKQEENAKAEINSAILAACGEDPNQASCLEAGKTLASKAAELHDNLSKTAGVAIERLAGGPSSQ